MRTRLIAVLSVLICLSLLFSCALADISGLKAGMSPDEIKAVMGREWDQEAADEGYTVYRYLGVPFMNYSSTFVLCTNDSGLFLWLYGIVDEKQAYQDSLGTVPAEYTPVADGSAYVVEMMNKSGSNITEAQLAYEVSMGMVEYEVWQVDENTLYIILVAQQSETSYLTMAAYYIPVN